MDPLLSCIYMTNDISERHLYVTTSIKEKMLEGITDTSKLDHMIENTYKPRKNHRHTGGNQMLMPYYKKITELQQSIPIDEYELIEWDAYNFINKMRQTTPMITYIMLKSWFKTANNYKLLLLLYYVYTGRQFIMTLEIFEQIKSMYITGCSIILNKSKTPINIPEPLTLSRIISNKLFYINDELSMFLYIAPLNVSPAKLQLIESLILNK